MSAVRAPKPKWLYALIFCVGVVVLLGGGYLAGNSIFPSIIKSNYQNKNCDRVIHLNDYYSKYYTAKQIERSGISEQVGECAAYITALDREQQKAWQNAFSNYKKYSESYPSGIFVKDAHEHTALVMTKLAREQLVQKQYSEASQSLKLIFSDYRDTVVAKESGEMLLEVYAAWEKDLRDEGEYADAEKNCLELNDWAQKNFQADAARQANTALAQTYLEWGQAIEKGGDFMEASRKYEQAIQVDPAPDILNSPAFQAQHALPKLHIAWGDVLFSQQNVDGALGQYQTAIDTSTPDYQPTAKDALANVYLKFATDLASKEDFLGALDQITLAENSAGTGTLKESITETKKNIYAAFSTSSGEQAQAAITAMVKATCEGTDEKTSLPIFGTDAGSIKALLYGVETFLPQEMTAQKPSELRYVICAVETPKEIERFNAAVITVEPKNRKEIYRSYATFLRVQYIWDLKIFKVGEDDELAQTTFSGKVPGKFLFRRNGDTVLVSPSGEAYSTEHLGGTLRPESVYGDPPAIDDVMKWILSYIN